MKTIPILANLAFASMLFGACAQSVNTPAPDEGEKTDLKIQLSFEGAKAETKAAASTAIPITSWDNVKDIQFFLYDADNNVKYSMSFSGTFNGTPLSLPGINTGIYTLVAIANVGDNDQITTSTGGETPEAWTQWNVRGKTATNLTIRQKEITFPDFFETALTANKAYMEPTEIFKGVATNVTVSSGSLSAVDISLTRQVSLMRVRLAENGQTGLDFIQNSSILVYRLPEDMNLVSGVSVTSKQTDVLCLASTALFNTIEPVTGYSTGGTILSNGFTKWRDIKVFPNELEGQATILTAARKYFIVITAQGAVGHVLGNGTKLTTPSTVYWSGVINEPFKANEIREVNLTLRTGGTTDPVTRPTEEGNLSITVSQPEAWNSVIVTSDIPL